VRVRTPWPPLCEHARVILAQLLVRGCKDGVGVRAVEPIHKRACVCEISFAAGADERVFRAQTLRCDRSEHLHEPQSDVVPHSLLLRS